MNKQAFILGAIALAGIAAQGAEFTFKTTSSGLNWSDVNNWDPQAPAVWDQTHTGIVENATAVINAPLGGATVATAPTIIVKGGGLCDLNYTTGSGLTLATPFVLDGGNLAFKNTTGNIVSLNSTFNILQPATITLGGRNIRFFGFISGAADLTLAGNNTTAINNYNEEPRFWSGYMDNSKFTGVLHIKTRICVQQATHLGAHPGVGGVIVYPEGFLDLDGGIGGTRHITLDGGALRSQSGAFNADIYVKSDSWVTPMGTGTFQLGGKLSGPGSITAGNNLARSLAGGSKNGAGALNPRGDNRSWTGDLILNHTNTTQFTEINGTNARLNGRLLMPNETPVYVQMYGVTSFTNDIIGPMTLTVHDSALCTMTGAKFAPAGKTNTVGTTTLRDAFSLVDCVVEMRLLSASNHDKIIVDPRDAAKNAPNLRLTRTRLDVSATTDIDPLAKVFLVIDKSPTAYARNNLFSNYGEGALVTLCNNPLRTATITYQANYNNGVSPSLTGGNDIALYDFFFETPSIAPSVSTNMGATAIHGKSATLNGKVLDGNPPPHVWFYWSTNNPGTPPFTSFDWEGNTRYMGAQAVNAEFDLPLTGLTPGTTYYYAVRATNIEGETWSDAAKFSTLPVQNAYWTGAKAGWSDTNGHYEWTDHRYWTSSPVVPNSDNWVGYITNGFTASIFGPLGSPGNRPTIVVKEGGRLMSRDVPAYDMPIVLDGGDLNFTRTTALFPNSVNVGPNDGHPDSSLTVLSDSTVTGGAGDVHRVVKNVSVPKGVTLTVTCSMYFGGANPDLKGNLILGPCSIGPFVNSALGTASIHLVAGTQFKYNNISSAALNLHNPFSGFGKFYSHQEGSNLTGLTVHNALTPGDANTPGTLVAETQYLTLTGNASLNINIRDAQNHGVFLATNNVTAANLTIKLLDNPALNLNTMTGFKAKPGDKFVILRNTGANKITGVFKDAQGVVLEEGAKVKFGYASGKLTYEHPFGGNPYNIAITDITVPGTLLIVK